ncbi:MAG: SIR2 family protein [Chitinophagaceae bacterium]
MNLQPRAKHAIVSLLSSLIWEPNNAKRFCDDTEDFIQVDVRFQGSARDFWNSIVTEAERQEKLLPLLDNIFETYNQESRLQNFIEDQRSGFDRRVKTIAKAIRNRECVLFIGPELLRCPDKSMQTFSSVFSNELVVKLDQTNVYYDPGLKDSLSYVAHRFEEVPKVVNRELGKMAQISFQALQVYRAPFQKIASLSFPMIISANPDSILEEELTQQHIPFVSDYYDMSNSSKPFIELDEKGSIIYKIFGSFDNPYSILFTDNDRVQFSKNVVKNDPPLPPPIKMGLGNKHYLFLGFNFQEWHLKILMDCLGLSRKEERSYALLLDNVNESNIEHFIKIYKFYFINEQIDNFLQKVVNEYNEL